MRRKYHTSNAFLDLLFNMLIGITALFFIAFLMINPVEKKSKNVESKAEFIITVSWDDESPDDVDTYLEDPLGNVLFYQAREVGVMHLDRDDLGTRNDMVTGRNGEKILVKDNREIATIRGIVPGEYILNVHMYTKKSKTPTRVKITVDKINPFSSVSSREIFLLKSGDEKTACRFTIDNEGKITGVTQLPKILANQEENYDDYSPEDYNQGQENYQQEYEQNYEEAQ